MPTDSYFRADAKVSTYTYQLGLQHLGEPDSRNPRVVHGDPAFCALLERACPHRNSSTNCSLNFCEHLSSSEIRMFSEVYVERVLMAGVDPKFYAYTVIQHDEAVRDDQRKPTGTFRTSAHIKIVNWMLPTGGHIQPMYAPKERNITSAYLAHISLYFGYASPHDPERTQNVFSPQKESKISEIKRAVEQHLKAARDKDGKPNPTRAIQAIAALGFESIESARGIHGRMGFKISLSDHSRPLRFFGSDAESIHHHLNTVEQNDDHRTSPQRRSKYAPLFPEGKLDRSLTGAERIKSTLRDCLGRRADHNRQAYALSGGCDVSAAIVLASPFFLRRYLRPSIQGLDQPSVAGERIKEKIPDEDLESHPDTKESPRSGGYSRSSGLYSDHIATAAAAGRFVADLAIELYLAVESCVHTARLADDNDERIRKSFDWSDHRLGEIGRGIEKIGDCYAIAAEQSGRVSPVERLRKRRRSIRPDFQRPLEPGTRGPSFEF